MDSEEMFVNEELVEMVNAAKDRNANICAAGTSVLRAVASAVCMNGHLMTYEGWTNKFIFPLRFHGLQLTRVEFPHAFEHYADDGVGIRRLRSRDEATTT